MSSSRTQNLIRSRKLNINNCNSLKRLTAIAYTLCQAQLIMRWIVNYFRQVFCKHDFEYDEVWMTKGDGFGGIGYRGEVVYKRCKKCGYESSRNKW